MRNTPTVWACRSRTVTPTAPRATAPCFPAPAHDMTDMLMKHSTQLQNAADATVAAVLKANLPPAAFAVLEEFRKDFDRACEGAGNTPLLQALDHLSEPDTQRVLCSTLRRLLRNA